MQRDGPVCLDASGGVEVSLRRIAFECAVGPDGQSGRVTVMNRWDVPVKVYAAVCFSDGHKSLLLFDQLAPGRAQVKATEGRCNAAASIIKSQVVFQYSGERECFSDFPDCN